MKWIVAFISLQILLIGPLFSQAYINTSGCDGDTAIIYDGYTYNLVEIDGQCWFAENLKTSIYCNNDTMGCPTHNGFCRSKHNSKGGKSNPSIVK